MSILKKGANLQTKYLYLFNHQLIAYNSDKVHCFEY